MDKERHSPNEVHEMEGRSTMDSGGAKELALPCVICVACLEGDFLLRM